MLTFLTRALPCRRVIRASASRPSRLRVLEKVIDAARRIAMALDPMEATQIIIRETCDILGTERATIFRVVRRPGYTLVCRVLRRALCRTTLTL